MPLFKLDQHTLRYQDQGQGVPLVLLHPFPLSGASFRAQLSGLTDACRLIVPDLPGFGESPPWTERDALSMGELAQLTFALMDHLGLSSAVLGGVSMGGYICQAALSEDAGRVRGLLLADTQATADDEAQKARREQVAQEALAQGTSPLVASLLPKLLAPDTAAALVEEVALMIRQASPAGVAAASRGMGARGDSRGMLARFEGPALVVVGELDGVTPLPKAKEMVELLADARLDVLPGAGHLSHQEAPDAFNAAVRRFLGCFSGRAQRL